MLAFELQGSHRTKPDTASDPFRTTTTNQLSNTVGSVTTCAVVAARSATTDDNLCAPLRHLQTVCGRQRMINKSTRLGEDITQSAAIVLNPNPLETMSPLPRNLVVPPSIEIAMESTSKDLLQVEHNDSSTSPLESALFICKKKDSASQTKETDPAQKPTFTPFPKSQVLGKVKDFLGVMEEANKRLELDAKNNSQSYDIEVINGNDLEIIEMDLMLGVADLHTPEALVAAESAIAGNQFPIMVHGSSSRTESDDSSDESEDDEDGNGDKETSCLKKLEKSNTGKDGDVVSESEKKSGSKKRARIIELS